MEKSKKRILGAFQRLRLRGDGIQTVSKLLQETRAENKILKDRNNQLERTVDSLNNRLIKNNSDRGGGVGENCVSHTSSTAAQSHLSQPDEELSAPVTSRQLVENLVKENAKLKQHIQNPRKIDELIQKNFSLQSYNRQLAIDKTRVEEELTRLQNLLHLSDKDKDKELVGISSKLQSYKENYQREKSLREALENQIQKLNNELADTAQACLAMRKQLPSSTTQQLERPSSPAQVLSTQPAAVAKLSTEPGIQEDNMRLQARCRELTLRLERHDVPDSQSYRRLDQLEDENRHLKSIIAERDREVKDLRDKCQLLEHQLKAYKDDFLKEREDRELMHQKLSSIEGKYQQLKDQTPQRQPIGNTGNNAWDSRQQSTKQKPSSQMTAKVPTVKEGKAQQWTAKSGSRSQARAAEDNVSLSSQTEVVRPANPPGLACYKCGKKFKREHHSDLIDHLDVCPS